MNTLLKISSLALLCFSAKVASAQQTEPPGTPSANPPKATAQSEAGEPRANTSQSAPTPQAAEPRTSQPALTPQAPPNEPRVSASQPEAGAQRNGTVQAAAGSRPASGPAQKGPGGNDRLELGTATVTGDREQPKVMYIVPWKKSDIGDLTGKPMNSLVDEILAPIDREVFKREVVYYKAVQADASQNGARGRPSEQGEK
jgi:hypothetical protein